MNQPPDFLVIGVVTQDVVPGGYTLGGTATYASITARNLGYRTAVLTSVDPALDLSVALAGIQVRRVPSPATSTFDNQYINGARRQYLYAVADPIRADQVPTLWQQTPVVHLGPLVRELGTDMAAHFADSLVGITPQGWLRTWDEQTRLVSRRAWDEAPQVLAHTNVLVFSEEDVAGDQDIIQDWACRVPIMVVTQGAHGADVYVQAQPRRVPGFPAREVDPTGAGDVFAAAFLLHLAHQSDNPYEAARYANCVASFCVEGVGVSTIPTREQVNRRLSTI
ncbi:MAG: ribokinase [Chloroflexi bacterium]|nr:ribokinase [Chloroflexota bacterium]MBU1752053.1 ribokinase [Chloroflexota bacterium]